MVQRPGVRVYVYNENVPFHVYRAFHELVQNSKVREVPGTIALSMDAVSREILAAVTPLESPKSPLAVARASTPEGLFAQVLSILASSIR